MRHFEGIIRNYNADDSIDRQKNLYEPREMRLGVLTMKEGDEPKYFTPKSDFGTTKITNLQVGLYGYEDCTSTEKSILVENIGYLRKQQSELYYEMVLKVNNAPDGITYKQFALLRPNGQELLGTYSSQETDLNTYIRGLMTWLEAYPHTRIDVVKDFNLLKIRIWENGNFRIRNEKITVGLGTVRVLNENLPTLIRQDKTTYSRPAYNTSDLVIGGDVTEGNIFTLDTTVYTATKADTSETVKAALLGSNTKVIINVGDVVPISAVVGTVRTVNTNNPTINLLYEDNLAGNDRYTVEVENVQKGNTFQVLRSGLSPLTIKAGATDTKATIEAFFNATGGFLSVPTGTTLTESAVPGVRIDDNTNNPSISISNSVLTPAQMTDKWKILIGTSVRKGNRYILDDLTITADDDDTYLTIATKLGLIDGLYFEIAEDGVFNSYAEKGSLYDEDNIADVQVISSPIRRISLQYLCEVKMPTGHRNKPLQISVSEYYYNDEDQAWIFVKLLTVSNYFKIEENPMNTYMLKCAALGEVFGFQYFEEGITQQIRVPLFLKNNGYETTIEKSQSVNNATVDGDISMREVFDFDVMSQQSWYHKALQCMLRSNFVFLDEMKISLIDYNSREDRGAKRVQPGSGSLYRDRYLMKNYGKLFLSSSNYEEKFSVITNFKGKILCIVLKNDLISQEILEDGEIYLPVGEYRWKAWVGGAVGDTVDMQIYHNGQRIHYVSMQCGRWNTLSLIRLYPHDELLFEEMNADRMPNVVQIDTTLETTIDYIEVEYTDEIGGDDELNGYVAPFIPTPATTDGDWRDIIDGSGDLSTDKYDLENAMWVVKSITS